MADFKDGLICQYTCPVQAIYTGEPCFLPLTSSSYPTIARGFSVCQSGLWLHSWDDSSCALFPLANTVFSCYTGRWKHNVFNVCCYVHDVLYLLSLLHNWHWFVVAGVESSKGKKKNVVQLLLLYPLRTVNSYSPPCFYFYFFLNIRQSLGFILTSRRVCKFTR